MPSPEELREFLTDTSPDKRGRLIDRLVASPEFVDKWAYFLMDTLRVQSKTKGYKLFHHYLKQSLAADRPYDDLARSISTTADGCPGRTMSSSVVYSIVFPDGSRK